jgi:hypothetical protein
MVATSLDMATPTIKDANQREPLIWKSRNRLKRAQAEKKAPLYSISTFSFVAEKKALRIESLISNLWYLKC